MVYAVTTRTAAAFNGSLNVVVALIKARADVNQLDEDDEPPSFYADMGGHAEILMLLKKHGAKYDM